MKAAQVINLLKLQLPYVTDLFSTVVSVTSLTRSGSTVTAITATPHGLTTGNFEHISGALTPNTLTELRLATDLEKAEIISYLRSEGRIYLGIDYIAIATTTDDHDLTELYQENVDISGADQADYNGEHQLLRVPNRKTFAYKLDAEPVTPATGTPVLIEDKAFGYNGWYETTVVDTTTFTYELTTTPASPALGTIKAKSNPRVSGAVTPEKAEQSYTLQADEHLWAFVVLGNTSTNKDRHVETDATIVHTPGTDIRLRQIQNFSIYVFSPSTARISGRFERDQMEDVNAAFIGSIVRASLASGFADQTQFAVLPTGHSFFEFKDAFYVHKFDFETQYDVVFDDTIDDNINVAFRDIKLDFKQYFGDHGEIIMSTSVDLDDEPLP